MKNSAWLRKEVRDRLDMLHVAPDSGGCDAGLYDIAVAGAVREVEGIVGADIVVDADDVDADDVDDVDGDVGADALLCAVADIAAADIAESVLLASKRDGAAYSRTDGDLTVRFAEGTSAFERTLAAVSKMRERGRQCAVHHRRLVW